jgi:hypothetical protein
MIVAWPAAGRGIADSLRELAYEVHRTPGGRSVPELLERIRPDLVIVSADTPLLDGAVIERTLIGGRSIPILVVGSTADGTWGAGLPSVPRSVTPDQLQRKVAALLALGR